MSKVILDILNDPAYLTLIGMAIIVAVFGYLTMGGGSYAKKK